MAVSSVPLQQNGKPPSVEPLKFVYDLPPISERQLAIVKLVARYVACDESFAQSRALEFDFTSPSHGLHSLYRTYVDQYKLVLEGARPVASNVLDRAVQRALQEQEVPKSDQNPVTPGIELREDLKTDLPTLENGASKNLARNANSFAAIDWQNFVVLETVEFFSADLKGTSRLSAPLLREEAILHREQSSRKRKMHEPMYKSPYTGESIPASQFDEHMRVHALDPAWQKQKQTAIEKQAVTNLDTKSAADNLARLQEKRRRLLEE